MDPTFYSRLADEQAFRAAQGFVPEQQAAAEVARQARAPYLASQANAARPQGLGLGNTIAEPGFVKAYPQFANAPYAPLQEGASLPKPGINEARAANKLPPLTPEAVQQRFAQAPTPATGGVTSENFQGARSGPGTANLGRSMPQGTALGRMAAGVTEGVDAAGVAASEPRAGFRGALDKGANTLKNTWQNFKGAGGAKVPPAPPGKGGMRFPEALKPQGMGLRTLGAVAPYVLPVAAGYGSVANASNPEAAAAQGGGFGAASTGLLSGLTGGLVRPEQIAAGADWVGEKAAKMVSANPLPDSPSWDERVAKYTPKAAPTKTEAPADNTPAWRYAQDSVQGQAGPAQVGASVPGYVGQGNSQMSREELEALTGQRLRDEAAQWLQKREDAEADKRVGELAARASNGDLGALGQLQGIRASSQRGLRHEDVGLQLLHDQTQRRAQDMHMLGLQYQKQLGWAGYDKALKTEQETRNQKLLDDMTGGPTIKDDKGNISPNPAYQKFMTPILGEMRNRGIPSLGHVPTPYMQQLVDIIQRHEKSEPSYIRKQIAKYIDGHPIVEASNVSQMLPAPGTVRPGLAGATFENNLGRQNLVSDWTGMAPWWNPLNPSGGEAQGIQELAATGNLPMPRPLARRQ